MVDVLTPQLKGLVHMHFTVHQFGLTGCTREDAFAGLGVVPLYEMECHPVFTTDTELGTYNHRQSIAKWKGEYWLAWDNCRAHEEYPGQRTFISHSRDAVEWSDRILIADGDERSGKFRDLEGLYPKGDTLYAFITEKWDLAHAGAPSASAEIPARHDIWATTDGTTWELVKEDYADVRWMLESPRLTAAGRLMTPATDRQGRPGVLLWPGNDPLQEPKLVLQPWRGREDTYYEGYDWGLFSYGEAAWYTDDDDRIWMFLRDESASTYLGVSLSEDGGETWTEIMRTNFPDCMSRVAGGRLPDGRFFLVGNSTRVYMDRNFLAISLSDDGAKFNKMIQLIKEPTRQRFEGHLKVHGHQYPSYLIDGNRLLIAYSVNKEDIAVGIVNTEEI